MGGGPVSGPTDFFYYVAVLYRLLGPGPLYVPLINASLGVGTAAVAYALARRHGDRSTAEVAALLVGFWPSGVLWSSQILKDSMVTFLMLVSLDLVLRTWEARRAAVLLPAGCLVASVALLTRNRPHVAAALTGRGWPAGVACRAR
jgi:4-amino-4-deoxy-L-arabinose transferase-like glycosyltransferase